MTQQHTGVGGGRHRERGRGTNGGGRVRWCQRGPNLCCRVNPKKLPQEMSAPLGHRGRRGRRHLGARRAVWGRPVRERRSCYVWKDRVYVSERATEWAAPLECGCREAHSQHGNTVTLCRRALAPLHTHITSPMQGSPSCFACHLSRRAFATFAVRHVRRTNPRDTSRTHLPKQGARQLRLSSRPPNVLIDPLLERPMYGRANPAKRSE